MSWMPDILFWAIIILVFLLIAFIVCSENTERAGMSPEDRKWAEIKAAGSGKSSSITRFVAEHRALEARVAELEAIIRKDIV